MLNNIYQYKKVYKKASQIIGFKYINKDQLRTIVLRIFLDFYPNINNQSSLIASIESQRYKQTQKMNKDQNQDYADDNNYEYGEYNQQEYYDNQYYIENQGLNDYEQYSNNREYEILPYNALFAEVSKHLKTAQEMTALPQGWCLLLLREFKWDIDLLTEYFQDTLKYQKKIHFNPILTNPNHLQLTKGQCEVCCTVNTQLYQNICGHGFCQTCLKSHLQTSINGNNPFPKCMGCECPILYETIIYLLKNLYQSDRRLLDKYQKVICELFSSIHRNYQFCTGVDCNNCIKVSNLNIRTVKCTCGKAFCFKCKSDDHSPCSCEDKKVWLQNVLKEQADAKWMSVHTKLCPWCKKAVERSAGCNFMACVCGKSFCYLCSRPWQPDHKDHFKCHIFKKSTTEHVNREKQILQKMNFFTQRFLANQATANNNKKTDTFEQRKLLFNRLKIDLSDSEFIQSAYKFSIQCCESLKWIYAYSYYANWNNELQKQNFDFHQGQFEKYKENLLKMLAFDLKKFIKLVQDNDKPQAKNKKSQKQLIQEFKQVKKNIVNYYTMTKKYKQKFVIEIQNRNEDTSLVKKKSLLNQTKLEKKPSQDNKKIGVITRSSQKEVAKEKPFDKKKWF